jgi:hypothetical protein
MERQPTRPSARTTRRLYWGRGGTEQRWTSRTGWPTRWRWSPAAAAESARRSDTAAVVAFPASEDAGFVTGQVIYNAGGQRGPIRLDR